MLLYQACRSVSVCSRPFYFFSVRDCTFVWDYTLLTCYQHNKFSYVVNTVPEFHPQYSQAVKKVVVPKKVILNKDVKSRQLRNGYDGRIMAKFSVLISSCFTRIWHQIYLNCHYFCHYPTITAISGPPLEFCISFRRLKLLSQVGYLD